MEVQRVNLAEMALEHVPSGVSAYKRVLVKAGDTKNSNVMFINEAYLPSGQEIRRHTHHDLEEIVYFVSGNGKMTVGEREVKVKKGDRVIVPDNHGHSVKNMGSGIMKFICFGIKIDAGAK